MTGDWGLGTGEEAGEQGAGSRGKIICIFPITNHQSPITNHQSPIPPNA
ncbi:hypothetical protein [Sphaerospermopsis reniformis]|nr:hypothetical protein [Sphaerospermopsis reniformis]